MKTNNHLIDPDMVDWETHPESTIIQLLWLVPAILLIILVIAHVIIGAHS